MQIKPGSLKQMIIEMRSAAFFVGVGSGLSWLAWACDIPVVLISGFSEKYTEFKCERVGQNDSKVCSGCFNRSKIDSDNWNWCPDFSGTERRFECTKEISSENVINSIKNILT